MDYLHRLCTETLPGRLSEELEASLASCISPRTLIQEEKEANRPVSCKQLRSTNHRSAVEQRTLKYWVLPKEEVGRILGVSI